MPEPRTLHSVPRFEEPKARLDYLPAGIACIVFFGVLVWIFSSISPAVLKNFLFPSSFLPLLPVLFLWLSSGLLFITLNIRRAVLWGICITLLIWFQFQHVLDLFVLLYVVFPFLFLEFVLTFLRER